MIAKSHKAAGAERRSAARVMAKSSGHARLSRAVKADPSGLKSLNQALRTACEQLQNSLQHFRELYDLAPAGYVVFDADGVIQEINLAGAELLGAKRGPLIGQPFAKFLSRK